MSKESRLKNKIVKAKKKLNKCTAKKEKYATKLEKNGPDWCGPDEERKSIKLNQKVSDALAAYELARMMLDQFYMNGSFDDSDGPHSD